MIKGFSHPPEVQYANYNPEILTSQKRQWAANFHLQYNGHKSWKEPAKLFESMVFVGLHPNFDIQALQRQYLVRRSEGSGKFRSALGYQNQSRVEPNVESQVLFVYPPDKQLPFKEKDLLSFCFLGGLETSISGEADPSNDAQNSVQKIIHEMMISSQMNRTGGMVGANSLGNDMKNVNGILPASTNTGLNGGNGMMGNRGVNSNPGVGGYGTMGLGPSGLHNGMRPGMGNNSVMNGRGGMTSLTREQAMNHQQDMSSQLLSGLGAVNGFQ
ncbi:hypothetical protein KIW84_030855 [Lathyrus oleraceus]|uniref:Uncharacterized protein n=1 Tax=Pisum sativum TaxID=3888 RepID=A0A9D4XQU1_PEA|nr:hypothetical protein KIW84_030855 [Pisum sativum]